jgi:hypothetical protein
MENRSFDHFLGWLPGANGKQAGLSYPDTAGALHPTYHLTTFQGCGHPDPDHSYAGARTEYDNGKCDGWLRVNDQFSIGYYQQPDLPFLGQAAPAWTVCDNYFAATLGPTFPNRLYLHAAQTDRTDNTFNLTSIPTIWDRLAGGDSSTPVSAVRGIASSVTPPPATCPRSPMSNRVFSSRRLTEHLEMTIPTATSATAMLFSTPSTRPSPRGRHGTGPS